MERVCTELIHPSVIRGSIDIVIALPMSASWTPMMARVQSQYAFRMPCPCELTVVYEMSPPLNLAGRDIAYTI